MAFRIIVVQYFQFKLSRAILIHYLGLDVANKPYGAGDFTGALHLRPEDLPDVIMARVGS